MRLTAIISHYLWFSATNTPKWLLLCFFFYIEMSFKGADSRTDGRRFLEATEPLTTSSMIKHQVRATLMI